MSTSRTASVFVIHGRNARAAAAMTQFLRAANLAPILFRDVVQRMGGSPFVGDVVNKGIAEATAIVALFTADEVAALRPSLRRMSENAVRLQSRPNVIFESGLAFGTTPDRTILVVLGSDVALFSDAEGRHYIQLDNSTARRRELLQRLKSSGCAVDVDNDKCYSTEHAGDFEIASVSPPTDSFMDPFLRHQGRIDDCLFERVWGLGVADHTARAVYLPANTTIANSLLLCERLISNNARIHFDLTAHRIAAADATIFDFVYNFDANAESFLFWRIDKRIPPHHGLFEGTGRGQWHQIAKLSPHRDPTRLLDHVRIELSLRGMRVVVNDTEIVPIGSQWNFDPSLRVGFMSETRTAELHGLTLSYL